MSTKFMQDKVDVKNIPLQDGEKLVISRDSYRNFDMPLYERHGIVKKKNLLTMLHGLSKPVFDTYMEVYDARNKATNIATLGSLDSKTAIDNRGRYLNVLHKADIIRKVPVSGVKQQDGLGIQVKKFTYMINPYLLIPQKNDDFSTACFYWIQLKPKVAMNKEKKL